MFRIGITGAEGFIGTHLFNYLGLQKEAKLIKFERTFFLHENKHQLQNFVKNCDVIVHLAAINRHEDPQIIYQTNIDLILQLIDAMKSEGVTPHVIFSSSTQEEKDNPYGKSKKEGRELFSNWAEKQNAIFTGLIIPNVFGPFGNPHYNSVIATFCHQLTHHKSPEIDIDQVLKLIYVGELVEEIWKIIIKKQADSGYRVPFTTEAKVSDILASLVNFRTLYFENNIIPEIQNKFELNLFNTFRSYIDHAKHFPVLLNKNTDNRGAFVETVKAATGGQFSFSSTLPAITRGNHFHTRKIERFAVIRGRAVIELRRIGTKEILHFELDGEQPAFVDMPIWYTHNITNVGEEELLTLFWINEFFDPNDADTFFENV